MNKVKIDRVISNLSNYISDYIDFDKNKNESNNIAQMTTALAELVSARALLDKD